MSDVSEWSKTHAIVQLFGSLVSLGMGSFYPLLIAGSISFFVLFYRNRLFLASISPFAGYANQTTLVRLLIIVGCFLSVDLLSEVLLALLLGLGLLLDVLDGYLARRYHQQSQFGQYFDMEVDAFFVLLMTLHYFTHGLPFFWVLVPGLIRYVYEIYLILNPKTHFVQTKQTYASIIAGIFFVILIGCLLLPTDLRRNMLLTGTILIVTSFSFSIYQHINFKDES